MKLRGLKCVDCVAPSPRDHHQSTCVKRNLSERDRRLTLQHVASREVSDQDWTSEIGRKRGLRRAIVGRHVDASRFYNRDWTGDFHGIVGSWPTIIARL